MASALKKSQSHHHIFRPRCFCPAMLFAFSEIMEVDQSGKKNPGQDSFGPFASGFFLPNHLLLLGSLTEQVNWASSVMSKPVLHDLWGATTGIKWSWNPLVREDWAKRILRQMGKKNPDIFGPDHMSGFFWPRMFLVCDLSKNDEKNPDK